MMQQLGCPETHDAVIGAIEAVLADGQCLTADMGGCASTADLGQAIAAAVAC